MNVIINKILKILLYIIITLSIFITGYYYLYLWIINPNSEDDKVILKEKNILLEEIEDIVSFRDLLDKNNTQFNNYAKVFIVKKIRGESNINIKIKDTELINKYLWYDFLDKSLENYFNINIFYWNNTNYLSLKWKINSQDISLEWEYDKSYFYIKRINLDGIFSMINYDRFYFFKNELKSNVNYTNLYNKKIDLFLMDLFDYNIWKSKEDLFLVILEWISKIFKCSDNICLSTINDNTQSNINTILLENKSLTISQKSKIIELSKELINYLKWTNFVLKNNWFNISSKNNTLIFDFVYNYVDNKISYESKIDKSEYWFIDKDNIISIIKKDNNFFLSIMSNSKDIVNILLDE